MHEQVYDVVVVGAGPAGSYAAYLCAKRGLETLLLEKERLPRRKCCAGGVLERALRELDFPVPDGLVEREVHGAAVLVSEHRNEIRFRERVGITVRRERFDHFLTSKAEEAGAVVVQQKKVVSAHEGAGRVEVMTDGGPFQGRCLILADGVGSKLAEGLMGPLVRNRYATGMSYNLGFESDPDDLMEFRFYADSRRGRFSPLQHGYGWMFPCHLGANIGAGGAGFGRTVIEGHMAEIEAACVQRYGPVTWREDRAGHPLPLFVRGRLHSLRSMAIGDAGGLANPITGEGLSYAFASAALAAEAAHGFAKGGLSDAPSRYERECRRGMVRDMEAARVTQSVVRKILGTVDLERFFDSFCASEELKAACFGIVTGSTDWKLLLRRVLPRFPYLYFHSV